MGKGFGVNSKAKEGRERKAAQKEVKKLEEEQKRAEKEAQQWAMGAKTKSEKQLQEDKKKEEKARQKLEKERLAAAEEAELSKLKPVKPLPKEKGAPAVAIKRVTDSSNTSLGTTKSDTTPQKRHDELEDSSIPASHKEDIPEYSASNVDDALFLLDSTSSVNLSSVKTMDRHPERRVKAAYAAFEERELERLKAEYPGLRLTQLREKLQKLWQKAPENPFNQSHVSYNATKSQEYLKITSDIETNLDRLRFSPQ